MKVHYLLVGAILLQGASQALLPVCGDIRIAHGLYALNGLTLRFSEAGKSLPFQFASQLCDWGKQAQSAHSVLLVMIGSLFNELIPITPKT